jgi:putative peptidoglycan lipid II flippase
MSDKGKVTVVKAAGLLMIATILSSVLGYLRDIIIAAYYGQTRLTDAYQAAFSIPDFLYNLLAAGTVTAAFMPVFSSYIATDRQEEGWEAASTVFNITAAAMLVGITIAGLAAPYIVTRWLVPGFEPEYAALTVTMTRIMLIQAFFMALNGISMGILHSYQRFLGPALASVIYNVMIILFGAALGRRLGIIGFSIGVVAGSLAQFLIQAAGLRKAGRFYKPVFRWRHPGVRRIFRLMIPVLFSYTLTQLGLFVQQNISSGLSAGSVTAVRWAQRIMQLPVTIFAVTVVIAIFPTLNGQVARQEIDLFKKSFSAGLRSIFYITLPCAAGLAALSQPIVRLLYQRGNFSADNTALTAYTLSFFCLGLFAQGAVLLMNRVFYALQSTWTPVPIGAGAIALTIVLNLLLVGPLGAGGLALAYSIAAVANLLALLLVVRRKIGPIGGRSMAISFAKTTAISLVMGAAARFTAQALELYAVDVQTKAGQALQVGGAVAVGVFCFFGLSLLLRMEETAMAMKMLRRKN